MTVGWGPVPSDASRPTVRRSSGLPGHATEQVPWGKSRISNPSLIAYSLATQIRTRPKATSRQTARDGHLQELGRIGVMRGQRRDRGDFEVVKL